ncbi:hypothetical protein HHL16_08105 [Pseudoflavitalea sp. G-6-1-2]|uniref:hypothetical protein n=1 Tax=Pseudoflavitalea sp. G-6-1-2 TaxID=2728841 RepID=UPI00146AA377|nr:hypothetical protein [Pseudoflavitalea sp. G-6-1-2]NML20833.1 hypothetical protein [Pseudoflavitalea sp. G-6-1-2]
MSKPTNHLPRSSSSEVQEIIGKMPSWIIRWGIIIISVLLLGLLCAAYFFRYPDSIDGHAQLHINPTNSITVVQIPAKGSVPVKDGQQVFIRLYAYPENEFGLLEGRVTGIPTALNDSVMAVTVYLNNGLQTTTGKRIQSASVLNGKASIITGETSFFSRLVRR